MDNLLHGRVIAIDVSRDWLDVHCLPDGHRCRAQRSGGSCCRGGSCPGPGYRHLFGIERRSGVAALGNFGGRRSYSAPSSTRSGEGVCAKPWHMRQDRADRCRIHRPLLRIPARSRPQSSRIKAEPFRRLDIETNPVFRDAQAASGPNPRASKTGNRRDVRGRRHRVEATDQQPGQRT